METKYGFTKMSIDEFISWMQQVSISRTILAVQQHHTYLPDYTHFDGSNHFERQKAMKDYHVLNNGWNDIGQHFTIFPDGSILTGRGLEKAPACIYGQNAHAICLENLGNFDIGHDQMTTWQQASIVAVTAALCTRFNLRPSIETIVYHHWFDLTSGARNNGTRNNKSCPGTGFFGGNKVADCQANFIPLIQSKLAGHIMREDTSDVQSYVAVTASALRVRSGPSTQHRVASDVSSAQYGAILRVYEQQDDWLKISKSKQHWVSERYTVLVERAIVSADVLRVRSGPGTSFAAVDNRYKGEVVFVSRREGQWCRIALDDRWVNGASLEMD